MGEINKKKLIIYTNKLYRGLLKRYKEESEEDDIFSIPIFIDEERKEKEGFF